MSDDAIQIEYMIDGGNVKLTDVSHKFTCGTCSNVIALVNKGTILIKSFVSVLEKKTGKMTLRCGRCKTYNVIDVNNEVESGISQLAV